MLKTNISIKKGEVNTRSKVTKATEKFIIVHSCKDDFWVYESGQLWLTKKILP